jgi:hypothetical protein
MRSTRQLCRALIYTAPGLMTALGGKRTLGCYSLDMERWTTGYSQAELDAAQERFGLQFPPDLVDLLREKKPIEGYDWRRDDLAIRKALCWPLDGMLFDVEESDFWLPEWGLRPASASERAQIVVGELAKAPKLIPIIGHRYIPEEPHERGNPVFSVYQTDIIYYGADLENYFLREFASTPWEAGPVGPTKRVRFWSDLVDWNAS